MQLLDLKNRIKGAHLWSKYGKTRIYFYTGHTNKDVSVDSWLEMINGRIEVFVRVHGPASLGRDWCLQEAYKLRDRYRKEFHDIIRHRELERQRTPLHVLLQDNVPPIHTGSMPHQEAALCFLCRIKVGAFFGDVGIGKTKPAIDLANSRYLSGRISKVLIFCPCSTRFNFRQQIALWRPHPDLQWKIIGIESMGVSDRAWMEAMDYADRRTMIVIDESHLVKNHSARRSIRIRDVCRKSGYKLVMTGTPVTDTPANLYMQYAMLSHRITGCESWEHFERQFVVKGGYNMEEIIAYKNLDYLAGLVAPYTIQIKKEEVIRLPAKTFYVKTCGLTVRQRHYYLLKKQELLDMIGFDDITPGAILKYFIVLHQIACGFYRNEQGERKYLGSEKFGLLHEIDLGRPTIFFCKYLYETELLMRFLGRGRCALFTGKNTGERMQEQALFIAGKKQYFITTEGCGGTGLNGLTVANQIVFFSRSFRNTVTQCVGRIDRPGQKRQMFIHDLITDTGIDRLIFSNITRKRDMERRIRLLIADKTKLRNYAEAL